METGHPVLRRVSFGSNFGIKDEHVMRVAETFNKNLQVLELGSSDTGDFYFMFLVKKKNSPIG